MVVVIILAIYANFCLLTKASMIRSSPFRMIRLTESASALSILSIPISPTASIPFPTIFGAMMITARSASSCLKMVVITAAPPSTRTEEISFFPSKVGAPGCGDDRFCRALMFQNVCVEGNAQMRINDDSDRVSSPGETDGQFRIIRHDGSHADQDGVVNTSQPVGKSAGREGADPL
jgi:hypothetical protein